VDVEAAVKPLLTGLAMGESPRWHEDRLWLSDWGAREIIRQTLFIVAAEWRGMDRIPEVAQARTGQVLTIEAPAPGAGWP